MPPSVQVITSPPTLLWPRGLVSCSGCAGNQSEASKQSLHRLRDRKSGQPGNVADGGQPHNGHYNPNARLNDSAPCRTGFATRAHEMQDCTFVRISSSASNTRLRPMNRQERCAESGKHIHLLKPPGLGWLELALQLGLRLESPPSRAGAALAAGLCRRQQPFQMAAPALGKASHLTSAYIEPLCTPIRGLKLLSRTPSGALARRFNTRRSLFGPRKVMKTTVRCL